MLTPDAILARASPTDLIMCGIYFLIRDRRIVYVGQSGHIMARIASHMTVKRFDSWAWVPCPPRDLNIMERAYIDELDPEENADPRTRRVRWAAASLEATVGTVRLAPPVWPVGDIDLAEIDNSEAQAEYDALCNRMRRLRAMRRRANTL